jgi:hypothetical protein
LEAWIDYQKKSYMVSLDIFDPHEYMKSTSNSLDMLKEDLRWNMEYENLK